MSTVRVAILDDYQNVALQMADWSRVADRAEITVFDDHLHDPEAVVERLGPFDVVCVMRERTPLPRSVIARLPRLRMIASTGPVNAAVDVDAAVDHGILVINTGYSSTPTVELTWALILASARHLVEEANAVRDGGWQTAVGVELSGRVLGVLGLGRIGGAVARIGAAFGMDVIAWSEHLTPQRAQEFAARWVDKDDLFVLSDVLTVHVPLNDRTRGLVGADDLAAMKPTARLINPSRGPVVDQQALLAALRSGALAGAAVDVFDTEPLPADDPMRTLPTVLSTPHIGFVTEGLYRTFYGDAAAAIADWLDASA
jgi:phosphoglycerate dehydrogenase-like enzyme